eukprot:gene36848-49698_t
MVGGRFRSGHPIPDRQGLGSADKAGQAAPGLSVEFQRFQPRQQLLEQDPHFHLGQVLADLAAARTMGRQDRVLIGGP